MAGSGLHEAVKGPASIPLVVILCALSGGVGVGGWNHSSSLAHEVEESQKEVVNLRIEVGVLKKDSENTHTENERRFQELSAEMKEMKKSVDRIADKLGAR